MGTWDIDKASPHVLAGSAGITDLSRCLPLVSCINKQRSSPDGTGDRAVTGPKVTGTLDPLRTKRLSNAMAGGPWG